MVPILRADLASDSPEVCDRLAGRVAEFMIEKAMGGHFGYIKLILDLVDAKLYRTADQEMTFAPDCVVNVVEDRRNSEAAKAA